MPRAALPEAVAAHAASIDAALDAYLGPALGRVGDLHPALAPLTAALEPVIIEGGKRLRPVLLLLGHELAGGDGDDVMGAAIAVELLHTCALLHDDVIDQAGSRRGRPTIHVELAATEGIIGDRERYGEALGILLGDLAFVHADDAFLDCAVTADRLLAGMRAFVQLREEVMAGQALDVHAAATASTERELAIAIATLKSGRYSVTRPLQLGAVLAGAEESLLAVLKDVGDPLGRAFQVRDDLLGVFGDEATMGKSASGDLAEGKRTLLIAEAWARTDDDGRMLLARLLGREDLTTSQADQLRGVIETSGARDAANQYVADQVAEARAAMANLPASASRGQLEQLLHWFTTRVG